MVLMDSKYDAISVEAWHVARWRKFSKLKRDTEEAQQ